MIALAAALPLATAPSAPAMAAEPVVTVALHPAVDRPGPRFEGWGTALAWFAEVTGGWPEADRARLADLFYGPGGLGWTIARFNIGGGDAPGIPPHLRPGAAVPGYWRLPAGTGPGAWTGASAADWDWSADPRQRWWLDAVRRRVPQPIFEAFSNSPPFFMTVSGRVSGAERATDDNLRPGREGAFAAYLARVVDELERRHRIRFRTLSPVNEPDTAYWHATNTQEGSHWGPAAQARMIDAADAALRARGLATAVAAPDETNARLFMADWAGWPAATRARVGQLNVHSYGTTFQTGVRDIARAANIRLWMSENDTPLDGAAEDFAAIEPALAFAEHVVGDLKRLAPAAWVFWQAVEDLSARNGAAGGNWGLVKADLRAPDAGPHPIHVTAKYWAMAQFSRHVRPGDRLVEVDDPDTVGALSPDGGRLVLVNVNPGPTRRHLAPPAGWHGYAVVTDAGRHAACVAGTDAPARSMTTLVLFTRKSPPCRS